MRSLYLKFPSVLAGNGDATAYLVLAAILLLVGSIFFYVYRLMREEGERE